MYVPCEQEIIAVCWFCGGASGVPATEKWRDEWQSIRCTCGSEEWKSYTHLIQVSLAEPKRTDFLCSLWRGTGSTCLESKIARASDQQHIHQLKLSHLYSREKRLKIAYTGICEEPSAELLLRPYDYAFSPQPLCIIALRHQLVRSWSMHAPQCVIWLAPFFCVSYISNAVSTLPHA